MVAKVVVVKEEFKSLHCLAQNRVEQFLLQARWHVLPEVREVERQPCRVPLRVGHIVKCFFYDLLIDVLVLSDPIQVVKILFHLFADLSNKVIDSDLRDRVEDIELDE